jgi:predicted enzyme related to lactoylglutathione lyase
MGAPIVHLELSSADFQQTAAFYGELFGWHTQQNATASYMKFDGDDGPSAGWVRADMVQSPGPVPYLLVDDVGAVLDKVEKAGGRVIARRLPFAGGGEIGLFADPDGNVLGVWMRKKGEGKPEPKAAPAAATATAAAKAKPAPKTAARKPAKPVRRK